MRITGFQAENFKRLKAVEINPDDHTVVIAGRNAQGKSSVLDAIWAALAGKKGTKELVRPIRDGESKARVELTLDDLRIERKWTASGSTLTVGPKDGSSKFNSPQAILDKLIGALSFDPLEFAEADPKKQVETLIDLVGREQFDALATERATAYAERTNINRQVKQLQAEVDSRADAKPVEPVNIEALLAEQSKAHTKARLTERWEHLTSEINRMAIERADIEKQGMEIGPVRPIEEIQGDLAKTDDTNRAAQRWIDRQAAEEALEVARAHSEDLTRDIAEADKAKADLIAQAALPVPGLEFDEDGVTLDGVPFVQSSAAERLKVSVAMAMALNPELRVICIKDASLLDADSRKALVDLAAEHDYQIWYEVVGDGGPLGVVIEDGMVQS